MKLKIYRVKRIGPDGKIAYGYYSNLKDQCYGTINLWRKHHPESILEIEETNFNLELDSKLAIELLKEVSEMLEDLNQYKLAES